MDTGHKTTPSRRNFLLAVGAGSVAAAATAISGGRHSPAERSAKDEKAGQGYRLTEHVRNYYRTAQV